MKDIIVMWKSTRMIVLTAVTAAIYAAILIPFKIAIPLIPGFTEVRPASVIPIICSLMFGPAAAWGSAIGNTIGDFFGTLGPGTIFGFIGNFLYGYIPYKMWQAIGGGGKVSAKSYNVSVQSGLIALIASVVVAVIAGFANHYLIKGSPVLVILIPTIAIFLILRFLSIQNFLIILSASIACGVFIGWGVHLLGLVPFPALGNIIVLNNLLVSGILGPILLPILYPVIDRMGLLYTNVMDSKDISRSHKWASILMIIATISALIAGNWIAVGGYDMGVLGAGFGQAVAGRGGLGLGLLPFIILILISAIYM